MRTYRVAVVVLAGLAVLASGQTAPRTRIIGDVVPGANWETAAPESVGYSSAKLEALRGWVKTQDTGSMMVIVQGRVIFSYGDVSHTSKVASVRKSVLGMLYGKYVINGTVDLSKTVKDLGLEDKVPFLPLEEKATLEQLMASRSGIYLPTGNKEQRASMPPRESAYPGTHFVYNNWDFDAVGAAFEKATGQGIYEALRDDLALPLGMQDYAIAKQKKIYAPESVHPEYAMYLSTRDMARLGLLMLDLGMWNGKQVISGDWVRYMTTLVTPFREMHGNAGEPQRWGYGTLWWVWEEQAFVGGVYAGFLQGAYSAMGSGGTFITVLPAKDMVVVHQVDIDRDPRSGVSLSSYIAMLTMLADANCFDACN